MTTESVCLCAVSAGVGRGHVSLLGPGPGTLSLSHSIEASGRVWGGTTMEWKSLVLLLEHTPGLIYSLFNTWSFLQRH